MARHSNKSAARVASSLYLCFMINHCMLSQVEVDDDDEVMGDNSEDGYSSDLKLKGDLEDKEGEEALDFKFVSGNSGGQGKDSVDGLKGEDEDIDTPDGGEWGQQMME